MLATLTLSGTAYATSASAVVTLAAGRQTVRLQGATGCVDTAVNWLQLDAVDTTPPPVPVVEGDGTSRLHGISEPGAQIRIYVDGSGSVYATVTADGSGAWSWTATGLSPGSHSIQVAASDGINTSALAAAVTVVATAPTAGGGVSSGSGGCGGGLLGLCGVIAGLGLRRRR